jgi:hypothetical protein
MLRRAAPAVLALWGLALLGLALLDGARYRTFLELWMLAR